MTSEITAEPKAPAPSKDEPPQAAVGADTPAAAKSGRFARGWLVAVPLAVICTLAFCVTLGVVVGLRQSDAKTDSAPGTESAVETPAADPRAPTAGAAASTATALPAPAKQRTGTSSSADTLPAPAPTAKLPDICAGSDTTLSSSPPLTRPLFSPISFATTPGPNGWPLDAALQFTATITRVQATFTYIGMADGLPWERVWYLGDQELVRGSGIWDAGPAGNLSIFTQAQNFVPGRYRLQLRVDGKPVAEGSFVLVDETTPITRPVQVAFTTRTDGRDQIQLLNLTERLAAGSSDNAATPTDPLLDFARYPAWSPDTVGLLYTAVDGIEQANATATPGLWVYNTVQQQSYQLNEETWFQTLAWSPHRNFVASATADPRLILWDVQQSRPFRGPPGQQPAWSPDGLRLAWRGCSGDGWGIYTANVISNVIDMGSIRQLTRADDSQPGWSPDGQRLVFARRNEDHQAIFSVGVDGSSPEQLTDGEGIATAPAWTPDGQILYWAQRGGTWGLTVMDNSGGNRQLLLAWAAPADWQPDTPAVSSNRLLTEPTPPPPPKPRVQVPAGMGVLVVSNLKNPDEMTFTINNIEHKVGPYRYDTIPLPPGHYTWTASWPAKVSRTGIADVALGQVAYPVVER